MSKILQLVGFKVEREFFGVQIAAVKEIVRVPDITPVPDTPEFVEGVVNLRGRIVPVIDMRKRIGTILPLKFTTPSTNSGVSGTGVISGTLTISLTAAICTPKNSLSTLKPTN